MNVILDFFSDTLLMNWLYGEEILALFNEYFLGQSEVNRVLIIMGVGILSVIGVTQVVKQVLKFTILWVKIAAFIALTYYLFVVILGIDLWALLVG